MKEDKNTAVLLLSCPDKEGLVAKLSNFIYENNGNIIDLIEHVDRELQRFYVRIAWDLEDFNVEFADIDKLFTPIGEEIEAEWEIHLLEKKSRVAVFVSKYDHCLQEILWRVRMGEFNMEIPFIISNHPDLEDLAQQYGIPYYVFPIKKETKYEQEKKEIELLKDNNVDAVILARYMQILSPDFIKHYPNKIINIHHSFLPAFVGGNPYKQAYERGVKIIGATSHYVTGDLDQGPIITQDILPISHKDTLKDIVRKGRDLERLVLSRAVHYYLQHRVLVSGRRTIIFD